MKKLKGNCLSCKHCLHEMSFCGGCDAPVEIHWDCGITGESMTHCTDRSCNDAQIGWCDKFEHKLQNRQSLGWFSWSGGDSPNYEMEISCDADRRKKRRCIYFRLNFKPSLGDWSVMCDDKAVADSHGEYVDLELAFGGRDAKERAIELLENMLSILKKTEEIA